MDAPGISGGLDGTIQLWRTHHSRPQYGRGVTHVRPQEKCLGTVLVVSNNSHVVLIISPQGTTEPQQDVSLEVVAGHGVLTIVLITLQLQGPSSCIRFSSSRCRVEGTSVRYDCVCETDILIGLACWRVRPPQQTRNLAYRSHPLQNPSCRS